MGLKNSLLGIVGVGMALGGALKFMGNALLWISKALLLNPIGLAIAVIAGGAYLIYANWGSIKEWFGGIWDSIKSAASRAWDFLKGIFECHH